MTGRKYMFAPIVGIILAAGSAPGLSAQGAADTLTVNAALADRGKKLFSNKQCNTCHTIGRGKAVGPDLRDVTSRRSLAWIRRMIRTPETMLLEDSLARALRKEHGDIPMPNMKLSEAEVEAVIHYLASQSKH